ncbi:MAG: ATP-binding protein [Mongoliitalea sp.]
MHPKKLIEFTYKSPLITGTITFFISIVLIQLLTYRDYQIKKTNEKQLVLAEASLLEKKINTILNQAYAAASTLQIAYELVKEDKQSLDFKSAQLLEMFPSLDIIQVVEGGSISYVYPLEGNEKVIGYNILDDPKTAREAALAIERKKMFFAGPFELRQGGEGIVGRLPIFKNNQFWGFSVAIIKMETFQREIIGSSEIESPYHVQFSKIKPDNQGKVNFLPIPSDLEKYNGFKYSDTLTEGDWELTVQLKRSQALNQILLPLFLRIFISSIFGLIAYFLAQQPKILEQKVIKATKRWKRSNKRFQYSTKATSDTIWDWSLVTGKVYRSENFEKLFGYPLTVFTNDTNFWNDHIHPDDLPRVIKRLNEVKASQEIYWEEEFRFRKSNGEYADVVDKGIIIRDSEGRPIRIIGATQDISKTKSYERKLIQEKEFLNSLLDNLTEGILSLNPSHKITLSNKKARDILQLKPSVTNFNEILKATRFLTIPEYHPVTIDQNPLQLILQGAKIKNQEIAIQQKNEILHILISGEQINVDNDKQISTLIVLHDITDIRKKDLDLAKVSKELQNRAEALELSNAELERFAYITSHNLQEPLRMVSSFLKLIQGKYEGLLDDKGKSYIQFAIEGADRMKQLIMDVLEYSLADIGDEKTSINLEELIEEIKILERANIQETHASIHCDQSLNFIGVKVQIRQLLQHLINNSLKFKKNNENLHVSITAEELEDKWLFKVKDNGVGIKEDLRKKIFNIFEKDQQQSNHNSMGIGLAICKKIISKHNGEIWIESRENIGTSVYFTIEK